MIVICSSYENFVAPIDYAEHPYWPPGLVRIGFAGLKQKLLGSIVAIAAIHVLESFMKIPAVDDHELVWSVAVLAAFVVCALLLAVMNRISPERH